MNSVTPRAGDHAKRLPSRTAYVKAAAGLFTAGLLAACCPPATTAVSYSGSASAAAVEAGRGYGFAPLGLPMGGAEPAVPGAGSPGTGSGSDAAAASASQDAVPEADLEGRFESAWRLVAERYWDLDSLDVDWNEVGERYRARLGSLAGEDELYEMLEEMYDELGDNHSVYVPPARVEEIRASYGDLPCVAVFDSSAGLPSPAPLGDRGADVLEALRAQVPAGLPTASLGPIEYGLVEAAELDVGYVRLADLASEGTAFALREAVQRLGSSGADALVLDVRGNPGGRLVTMMQAAGVFTRGFLWRAVMSWTLPLPYPAIGEPVTQMPLVVLIDGGVNSAAEGLAGALQANGRAFLVGETTAGNVEAVLPFCLRDGSQAWIATGVLAPLLGATWEGRGVVPDLAVPSEDAYDAALDHLRTAPGGASDAGDAADD